MAMSSGSTTTTSTSSGNLPIHTKVIPLQRQQPRGVRVLVVRYHGDIVYIFDDNLEHVRDRSSYLDSLVSRWDAPSSTSAFSSLPSLTEPQRRPCENTNNPTSSRGSEHDDRRLSTPPAVDNPVNAELSFVLNNEMVVQYKFVDGDGDGDDDGDRNARMPAPRNQPSLLDHDIPFLDRVDYPAIQMTLYALDQGSFLFGKQISEQQQLPSRDGNSISVQLQEHIVQTIFYLGCEDSLLPLYCSSVPEPETKLHVAYGLYQKGHFHEVQTLLLSPSFFYMNDRNVDTNASHLHPHQDIKEEQEEHQFVLLDKSVIPLYECFTEHKDIAMILLRAYHRAPSPSLLSLPGKMLTSLKRFVSLDKKKSSDATTMSLPNSLSPSEFAIRILQHCAATSEWEHGHEIELLLSYLPKSRPKNMCDKPFGLEKFVSRAIVVQKEIPPILRDWNIDVALIAPALFTSLRLYEAPLYPDPQRLVRTIVDSWSVSECVVALEENQGGIRQLLERCVTDENCSWLASIPIFREACRDFPLGNDDGTVTSPIHRLLYRRLFLHTNFDPNLSPTLFATLLSDASTRDNPRIRRRILLRAVQYLEDGQRIAIEHIDNIPWHEASIELTERAAVALSGNDDDDDHVSSVWNKLDVGKLGDPFLVHVPAKILSRLAYLEARKATRDIRECEVRIRALERELGLAQAALTRMSRHTDRR